MHSRVPIFAESVRRQLRSLIAGEEEEEAGTLELETAAPVSRSQILTERAAVLVVSVVVLVAAVTLVCWVLIAALDMDVALDRLLAGSAGLLMLPLGFGSVALAVGAASDRRAPALGVAAVAAVLAFIFDALGPVVEIQWSRSAFLIDRRCRALPAKPR